MSNQLGTNLAEVGTDCISRQQAIDAVQNRHMMLNKEKVLLINDLEKLPSAQPEPCEDAVSRKKVKELAYSQIRSEYSGIALKEQREAMLRIADNVIGLLPPVTPKQEWIPVDIMDNKPEENTPVLMGIRFKDDFKYFVTMRTDFNYWHGLGRDIIGEMRYMPLPQPYKGVTT